MKNSIAALLGSAVILPLIATSPAHSQTTPEAQTGGITDIVVTARRRAETQQSVPIAITAFGAEALTARSVTQVSDLADATPNLTRTAGPTGGNDAFFFVRGIGQVDSNPAADPGVGIYIDGVYLARIQGASVDAFDLDRVEVLRGPQGTLFGRNTIGGAVSLTTRDPGKDLAFAGRVTVGSRNRFDVFGAVDLPLSDTLGVRVSGGYRKQDGWGLNVYTGDRYSSVKNLSGRIKLVWQPTADVKLSLSADALQARGTSAHTILAGARAGATTPFAVPLPFDLLADTSTDLSKNFESIKPQNDNDNRGVTGTLEVGLGGPTLKAIVAYRAVDQTAANDFDGTGYRLYDNIFDTQSKQLSGELQLLGDALDNRLSYVLGGYAFRENVRHNNAICLGTNVGGNPFAAVRNQGGCIRNNQFFTLHVESFAGFGQASFKVTPQLSLTVGGRYTRETKRQAFDFFLDNRDGVVGFIPGFPPPIPNFPTLSPRNPRVGVPTTYNASFGEFTPKLGIDFKPSENVLLYASYSRGFKSGGFNGRPSPTPTGAFRPIQQYDPEKLTAYEAGIKSDFFDRRLRFNLAGYYSIYDGIQLLVIDPASGFFNTANAGKSEIYGFELEVTAKPIPAMTVYSNIGYTHDRYTQLDPRAVGFTFATRLPVTPRWTVGLGGDYRADLGTLGSLTLRADYNYRSSVYFGATNEPLEFGASRGLLNLRATYAPENEHFKLSVFGLNVTDKRYITNAQDVRNALGIAFASPSSPDEWGAELEVKF